MIARSGLVRRVERGGGLDPQVWQWQVESTRKSGSSSGTTRRPGRASGQSWLPIQDSSDHRDIPDRAEPRLANEPDEMTEANDPTEPIDRIEPTLPMDRIEYAEPMDRIEPSERMDRIDRWARRPRGPVRDFVGMSRAAMGPGLPQ